MTNDEIEKLIDDKGLVYILTSLELITQEKSAHILASYQDKGLSKRYAKFSRAIYKLMGEFTDII